MTANEIKERLILYTAPFIKQSNEIFTAIYTTFSNSISTLSTAVENLKDADWSGKGLWKASDEYHVFYHKESQESETQSDMQKRFTINEERGTEKGIAFDISRILGDAGTTINFSDISKLGDEDELDMLLPSFLDTYKAIQVIQGGNLLYEDGGYRLKEDGGYLFSEYTINKEVNKHIEKIRREVIPIDCELILTSEKEFVYEVYS